jgi:hypothetical protein
MSLSASLEETTFARDDRDIPTSLSLLTSWCQKPTTINGSLVRSGCSSPTATQLKPYPPPLITILFKDLISFGLVVVLGILTVIAPFNAG